MTTDIDEQSPPFNQLKGIQRLASHRSGHASVDHVRHQLIVGRDRRTQASVLVKLPTKPGLVYERNLENEIASLTTINRELPDSPYFPIAHEHGRLPDSRLYLVISLFDELPLAASIGTEWMPERLVAHLRTAIAAARAITDLHTAQVVHVDLNPMNILYRAEQGHPVIRVVDFESSYEAARHAGGVFYDPPTTPRFSAPELGRQAPDVRADVFSLGAVLYTMLAGYQWTWEGAAGECVARDTRLDPDLKEIVQRAVQADPDQRYPTAQGLQQALESYLEQIWPGRAW